MTLYMPLIENLAKKYMNVVQPISGHLLINEVLSLKHMAEIDKDFPHINTGVSTIPFHPIHGQHQVPFVDTLRPKVEAALAKSGHRIHDWNSGIAAKDHVEQDGPRKGSIKTAYAKISKVLEENQPDLRNNFDARLPEGEHVMVITHNTYDVAGMSTNKCFTNCQTMDETDPINKLFYNIPHELKAGTFVGYLMRKEDVSPPDQYTDPDKAVSRIAFRPTNEIDVPGYRKPKKTYSVGYPYGYQNKEFRVQAQQIIDQHFPKLPDTVYKHDIRSYNDGQGEYQFGHLSPGKANNLPTDIAYHYLKNSDYDPSILKDHHDERIRERANNTMIQRKLNPPVR